MQNPKSPTKATLPDFPGERFSEGIKSLLRSAAEKLKGGTRRLFMAETVLRYGRGGQRWAQRKLGWNRSTIRKGTHELRTGIVCRDGFSLRGRNASKDRLRNLLNDIRNLIVSNRRDIPHFSSLCEDLCPGGLGTFDRGEGLQG